MPLPTQIHQDKALENISVAYMPKSFIADLAIPKVPVVHETDKYYVYGMSVNQLPETARANGAESNRVSFEISTSSYSCEEHALNDIITDRDRGNADKAINLEVDTTEILTQKILIRKEKELADICQDKNYWGNYASLTSTYAFSQNTTLSNPIATIDSATSKILSSSGQVANTIIIDDATFRATRLHVSINDRIKYTSADSITEAMLSKLFDVSNIYVGRAIYDQSKEGIASSPAFIWTNCAFVAYMETSPGLKKPSALYQFYTRASGSPYTVSRWRDDPRKGDVIEVSSIFDFRPVSTLSAYLIVDTA